MHKLHITKIEILKRTFEGKTDPSKNDNALTSKYYTSKKYLLRYKCTEYGGEFFDESYETKSLAENARELMLKYNFDYTDQKEFQYKGHTLRPMRKLTEVESAEENKSSRTSGYGKVVEVNEYTYEDFYEIAGKAGASEIDLFILDEKAVVIPSWKGFLRYDESIGLQNGNLTYFTECCGKFVDKHSENAKNGYLVEGEIPATGNTYCNRCKRDVTRTGHAKKTPRNADIDENGSWGYTLAKLEEAGT